MLPLCLSVRMRAPFIGRDRSGRNRRFVAQPASVSVAVSSDDHGPALNSHSVANIDNWPDNRRDDLQSAPAELPVWSNSEFGRYLIFNFGILIGYCFFHQGL